MISLAESNSTVLPLWRRLETTGYFTDPPPLLTLGKYSAAFHLVEKKPRVSQAAFRAGWSYATELPVAGMGRARIVVVAAEKPGAAHAGPVRVKRLKYKCLSCP